MFMDPSFLSGESAWTAHIPFAFLLMELSKPRLVVELGIHCGVSYCALCQAVAKLRLDSHCVAIDTWQGDEHTKDYPKEILTALRNYHDPRYGSFSKLLQSTFDDALSQFADGSIDLLHIDGLHTFEAVSHDYEMWKPKLSDSAVVLFHDTACTFEGFGVFKLWDKLKNELPSFEFEHASGLGVLGVGSEISPALREFFEEANANADAMRALFKTVGHRCLMNCALHFIVWQQQVVNQWKRQIGVSVLPNSEELSVAMSEPVIFAQDAANEVRRLALDDLRIRSLVKQDTPSQ